MKKANGRTIECVADRYSEAIYYELGIPRRRWFKKWRARREWKIWLEALRVVTNESYIDNEEWL